MKTLLFVLSAVLGLMAQTPVNRPAATGLIVGRVVEANGSPVPTGVIVAISGAGIPTRRVLVDPQARFLFTDLPAGVYTITATKSGYLDGAFGKLRPDGAGHPLALRDGEHVTDATVKMWRFATISGTVTDDADDPVPGVRVQVLKRTVVAGRWRFVNSNLGANADEGGHYRVISLVPGEYAVVITSLISAFPASFMEAASAARQTDSQASSDFPRITMTNGSFGVANDVTNGTATVRAGDMLLQSGAELGADGRTISVYPTVWYPSAPSLAQATILKLEAGENRTGIDLRPTLTPTVRISGHVAGPDGPVPYLSLRLAPAALDDVSAEITSSLSLSFFVSMTVSDANGDFTFMGVTPGSYVIRAVTSPPRPASDPPPATTVLRTADGMSSSVSNAPALPPMVTRQNTMWTATPVTAGDSDLSGVNVLMRSGLRVTGRIEYDGTATRPTGNELRSIRVSLDPADGRTVWTSGAYQGQVDPSGDFYTIGLMAGRYVLRAENLPRGWSLKSAVVGGLDISSSPLTLDAKEFEGLVLTLTDQPSSLGGTVHNDQGRGTDAAAVLIFPSDGVWTDLGWGRRLRSARPSREGAFSVTGLPAGRYDVVAVGDEWSSNWQAPEFLQKLARVATHVTVVDRQSLTVELTVAAIR